MALYRIVRNLWFKGEILPAGSAHRLAGLSERSREKLLARGTIRPVQGPPLAELPGWGRPSQRAARLARMGIAGSVEFLEVDPDTIATRLRVSPALVRRWQADVESWLVLPPAPARG